MAFKASGVMGYYRQQFALLRESERPRSLHRMAELREDAKSEKVQLEAAKALAHEPVGSRPSFNINLGITPGYVCAIPAAHLERAREILQRAGSTKHIEPEWFGDRSSNGSITSK